MKICLDFLNDGGYAANYELRRIQVLKKEIKEDVQLWC